MSPWKMAALQDGAAYTPPILAHRQGVPGKINLRRSVLFVSCFSTSFSTKRTGRKNRLRQKILKTLKEPIIPKLPPAKPILPIDSPHKEIEETGEKSENSEAGIEEVRQSEELTEIEGPMPAGVSGSVGILAKNSIMKYGLWLVGAFVFQTVCAVWFFGSADIDNKSGILSGSDESRVKAVSNGNVNGKMGLKISLVNSNIYVDELEMERKIEEIRVMAREAREKERLESKRNGRGTEDSEDIDGGKYLKSGIEEEVDNRLVKLRKKLGNTRLKMPVASLGYLKESQRRDGVEKGELDDRESNGALLFKKKYKFKGLSSAPIEKPKGFGSDDVRIRFENGDKNAISVRDGENQIQLSDDDPEGVDVVHLVGEGNKKGTSELNEATRNTRKKEAKDRGTIKQGKGKIAVKPKELYKGNDASGSEGDRDAKSAKSETGLWWWNLPHVLAIVMRRGDDSEGGEGLYTLRSISCTEDRISHMVAFEDPTDATNFCYLLESFFKDLELEDFKADVVPLTIKELKEALKLFDERVLVVKRGQLKLYAGQPLTDAEVALRAMIEKQCA